MSEHLSAQVLAQRPRPRLRWSWLLGMLAPALLVGVLYLVRGPHGASLEAVDKVQLQLFDGSRALDQGAQVRPGSVLRLALSAPGPGYALVVAMNEHGELEQAYPAQGAQSVEEGAAPSTLLPGVVTLDGSVGRERFYLLFTEHPVTVADIEAAVRAGHVTFKQPELPIHGAQSSVLIEKSTE